MEQRFPLVLKGDPPSEGLPVRVCSCPKRDTEREEKEYQEIQCPETKRRRMLRVKKLPPLPPPPPPVDEHLSAPICNENDYTIQLRIPGMTNVRNIMKQAYDTLAGEAIRIGNYQYYHPYLEEIQKKWKKQKHNSTNNIMTITFSTKAFTFFLDSLFLLNFT